MIPPSIHDWSAALTAFAAPLANHLWQSTVFAALAGLLTLALRRNQAHVRHSIWMAASLKFLLPFALLVSVGSHFAQPSKTAPSPAMYSTLQDVNEPFDAPITPVAPHAAAAVRIRSADLLPLLAAVVWLGGFVATLVVWGIRWRRVAKAMRTAAPVSAGRELDALRRIEQAIGLGTRRIDVRIMEGAMEPGVFGVVRPVLAWPAGISDRLDDAQLEAILAHEVCHVRRHDNLTAALHMFVQGVFWFHPQVWWVGARLVAERERACDEQVLEVCPRPAIYAQSILKVCEFCVESPLACVSGVTGANLKRRVMQIMTERVVRNLDTGRKLLLAVVAVAAIAAPLAFGVLRMIPMYGQVFRATGPLPSYEVVVIKPSKEDAHGASTDGEQTHYLITAKMLIQFAYGIFSPPKIMNLDVLGGPDWINTDVFDIVAKMPSTEFEQEQGQTRNHRHERRQLMEQSMLADRFKLKMHTEMRDQPVYALTVIKGGPKMTPAKDVTGGAHVNPNPGSTTPEELHRGLIVRAKGRGFEMTVKGMTLDTFVDALMSYKETDGKPVVNQTGLTGAYDFTLVWGPEETSPSDSGEVEEPPLFTAIQQQLGLKLAQTKGPAEVIVIDHIERPTLDSAELQTPVRFMLASLSPQNPARPEYEAATIKPNTSGCCTSTRHYADQMVMTNQTLKNLIVLAYAVQPYQVTGPAWMESERFDITAKYPPGTKFADRWPMLRTLLEDRFHLITRRETRDLSGYSLLVDKGGFKLKPSESGEGVTSGGSQGHTWTLRASKIEMSTLAWELADSLGEVVVDQTGLDGIYSFQLRWSVNDPSSPAANDADPAPSVFTALEETLGLRLQHGKVPVPVIVVDHIDRVPTEN